jgi:hypothetical protein
MVELMPNMHKDLVSNPRTTRKQGRKEERKERKKKERKKAKYLVQ